MTVTKFPAAQATAKRALGKPVDPRTRVEIPQDPFLESVYALIPKEYIPPKKEARYKSKYADQARKEYVVDDKPAASMGPAHVPLNKPNDFMKKGDVRKGERDRTIRKAALPAEPGPKIEPSRKDFIKQNALDNINSSPPSFLTKKDYGVNPDYNKKKQIEAKKEQELRKQQEIEARENQYQKQLQEQGIVQMPEEERLKILDGLKKNWEKLNNDYQRLSLTVDTVPKIARKVNMEQQLKEYEDLIDRFSNSNIHVNFNSIYS
ncbi:calmodulin-binding-domain-containing protein [Gorgonomyces haynaldii]|nr:calmodulin-binding-domain-containing protein [Gorgonomyces haynaldii]